MAITRWGAAFDEELPALAARLGIVVYDARLRLAGPIPVVALRTADAGEAKALMQWLRERGHGVVGCDASAVVSSGAMIAPRTLRLSPDALVAPVGKGELRVPWASIVAFVHAVLERDTDQRTVTTKRKLSLGRAALTGGLSFSKKETREHHEVASEREQVLYVFRDGDTPLLLCEHGLRYDTLGVPLAPTTAENFRALCLLLRERAPNVPFDTRLLTERRRATTVRRTGTSKQATISTSNAGATDLAAHLLALAHVRGAL